MQHTEKFQLSQWEQWDRIQREPFNSDNVKIEAALAQRGNCQLYTASYAGSGGFGAGSPTRLTFPAPPDFVVVYTARNFRAMFFKAGQTSACNMDSRSNYTVTMSWQGSAVSWYSTVDAAAQMNSASETYSVAALYRLDK